MCWQGCGKVQDWRGKSWLLWAFSLCNLKLLSTPEMLGSSSATALLYLSHECFGQQQKCCTTVEWAPSYNLSHHERKWQEWGHLVGTWNCRLSVQQNWCSCWKTWTKKHQHQGWSLQKPHGHCVQEICSRRNSICRLSLLAADARRQNLCHCSSFYVSIWPSKSRLQKAACKPKDATDIHKELLSSTPEINSVVWWDEGTSRVLPQLRHEQICFHKNQTAHPHTEGWPRGPGLSWDEQLKLQRPARSQHGSQCICQKFHQQNVF